MKERYDFHMQDNPLKLRQIHHVEFWVGNAKQAAFYYRQAFGFSQFAYAGLETGQRDMASHALQQGRARLVFRTPLTGDHPAAEHIRLKSRTFGKDLEGCLSITRLKTLNIFKLFFPEAL